MKELDNNEGKYLLTEPFRDSNIKFSDTVTSMMQKEESKILIKGQKYLIKLYKNDYSSLLDSMKKDVSKSRNIPTNLNKTKSNKLLPPISENITLDQEKYEEDDKNQNDTATLSQESFPQNTKYGINKFKQSNYVTSSCMKEFYSKYSHYNSFSRKYFIQNNTPLLAFIK